MNTLASYLKDAGRTQASFASEIGVTQAYIAKLCAQGTPSLRVALDIERATGGAVPARSWINAVRAAE